MHKINIKFKYDFLKISHYIIRHRYLYTFLFNVYIPGTCFELVTPGHFFVMTPAK